MLAPCIVLYLDQSCPFVPAIATAMLNESHVIDPCSVTAPSCPAVISGGHGDVRGGHDALAPHGHRQIHEICEAARMHQHHR